MLRCVLLLLACLCVRGQFFDAYVLPNLQWTPKGLLCTTSNTIHWYKAGSLREVEPPKVEDPFSRSIQGLGIPGLAGGLGGRAFFLHDHLWMNAWNGSQAVLYEQGPGGWTEAASVSSPNRKRRAHLVPLRNGRFLVFNPPDPDAKPGQDSVFFWGIFDRRENGKLEARRLEVLGTKDWIQDRNLLNVVRTLQTAVFTEDHVTLFCPFYGYFWVFSLEDGQLKRKIALYGDKAEKALKGLMSPRLVQEVQPKKDDTLLVAARDESVIERLPGLLRSAQAGIGRLDYRALSDTQKAGAQAFLMQKRKEVYQEIGFQRWFEVHPATGSVRRLNPAPVGAKEVMDPVLPELADQMFWMVDAEDRVTYTPTDFSALRTVGGGGAKREPGKGGHPKR